MTSKGHFLFSIGCAVFAKNAGISSVFMQGDWWHIIASAIVACLLPDIDHPKSFLGQKLKCISKPISRFLGHRGFTHSLLAILIMYAFSYLKKQGKEWSLFPNDVIYGMILGYTSHILADILTPHGVPLFWPWRWRCRLPILGLERKDNKLELILSTLLIVYAIWLPPLSIFKNCVMFLVEQIIDFLQIYCSSFIYSLIRYLINSIYQFL